MIFVLFMSWCHFMREREQICSVKDMSDISGTFKTLWQISWYLGFHPSFWISLASYCWLFPWDYCCWIHSCLCWRRMNDVLIFCSGLHGKLSYRCPPWSRSGQTRQIWGKVWSYNTWASLQTKTEKKANERNYGNIKKNSVWNGPIHFN